MKIKDTTGKSNFESFKSGFNSLLKSGPLKNLNENDVSSFCKSTKFLYLKGWRAGIINRCVAQAAPFCAKTFFSSFYKHKSSIFAAPF